MLEQLLFAAERYAPAAVRQIRRTHWLSLLGGTSGAYLFYFYAGVLLELQKPAPMIVFIG